MTRSNNSKANQLFLKSALCSKNEYTTVEQVIKWLREQNRKVNIKITQCPLKSIKGWEFNEQEGEIRHKTGNFFSIGGIQVNTNCLNGKEWQQPIINQPEVGYLGVITKEINGTLHFLLQAKIEPGNINHVQLSPTLQATRSNYTKIHQGRAPLYLDYFVNAQSGQILIDQLQSEQGSRFYKKRNRNIIIQIEEEIDVYDQFTWLTLRQIKELMGYDNMVNMDTRSVISGATIGNQELQTFDLISYLAYNNSNHQMDLLQSSLTTDSLHTIDEIISFLTAIKSNCDFEIKNIRLNQLDGWRVDKMEICHQENAYFKVIALDVEIDNREVFKWSQPMIQPMQEGICAFVAKKINGVLHIAIQAKIEIGNMDVVEFAPTVQSLNDNYHQTKSDQPPFLREVLNATKEKIVFDALQSEEGGRFYQDQNRYLMVIADQDLPEKLPDNYIWMTLNQLQIFMQFNNYLNIQTRSLMAAVPFI
jgi:oxidase EvaA